MHYNPDDTELPIPGPFAVPPSGDAPPFHPLPPVRLPRQCIGPRLSSPRRLCVVIGPFIGFVMPNLKVAAETYAGTPVAGVWVIGSGALVAAVLLLHFTA